MSAEGQLRIERVIGNNVVLAKESVTGTEYVLFGKGIGFSSKDTGYLLSGDPRIEKRFRMDDQDRMKNYRSLLEEVPPEVIQISEKIIEMVFDRFEKPVHFKMYLALPSHIHFAVYRLKNGMDIVNPFLYETKLVFSQEYEVACEAAKIISDAFQVDVPDDEIGFISYHIHSGIADISVGQVIKYTNLIHILVKTIEQRGNVRIARDDTDYANLISYLRNMIDRILRKKIAPNPFLMELKKNQKREYELAVELSRLIREHLQTEVPEEETGYMVLHLYRLLQSGPFKRN